MAFPDATYPNFKRVCSTCTQIVPLQTCIPPPCPPNLLYYTYNYYFKLNTERHSQYLWLFSRYDYNVKYWNLTSFFCTSTDYSPPRTAKKSMPVFMSNVQCSDADSSLLDCSYNGSNTDHSTDLGLKCKLCMLLCKWASDAMRRM